MEYSFFTRRIRLPVITPPSSLTTPIIFRFDCVISFSVFIIWIISKIDSTLSPMYKIIISTFITILQYDYLYQDIKFGDIMWYLTYRYHVYVSQGWNPEKYNFLKKSKHLFNSNWDQHWSQTATCTQGTLYYKFVQWLSVSKTFKHHSLNWTCRFVGPTPVVFNQSHFKGPTMEGNALHSK